MAQTLSSTVKPGDDVFILTGAGGPPVFPFAETDGVPGAAAIARALTICLRARVTILTEQRATEPVKAAIRAFGLNVDPHEDTGFGVHFVPTPLDAEACEQHAREIFEERQPTAGIAIERLSPNRAGYIHGATGINYDDLHTKIGYYFDAAKDQKILTCGIGDGGNEVGFGVVQEQVERFVPAGGEVPVPLRRRHRVSHRLR